MNPMMTNITSRPRRRVDVVRRLVSLVEAVPNLLKFPIVMATTRLGKQITIWLRR